MMKSNTAAEPRLHLLEKRSAFEIFFCSVLLAISAYSLYLLVSSQGVQQNTLFFGGSHSGDMFMDYFNVVKYTSTRDPYHYTEWYGLSEKAYPPLCYLILYPFSLIVDYKNASPIDLRNTQYGIMSMVFFLGLSVLLFSLLLYHFKEGTGYVKTAVLLALFSSGIFLYSLERANTIFLAAALLAAFLYWYKSENPAVRELSYMALACAAGLKVYPALFGILLIKEKRWFAAGRTVVYGLAAFFLPFLFFEGGFSNIKQMMDNANLNSLAYMYQDSTYRFGFLPYYLSQNTGTSDHQTWIDLGNALLFTAVPLSLGLRSHWKTVTLLTCALILSPVNSAYYCGLYLFIPIVLFLNEKKRSIFDWIYTLLFIIILSPYQFMDGSIVLTCKIANVVLIILYFLLLAEALFACIMRIYIFITKLLSKKRAQTGVY